MTQKTVTGFNHHPAQQGIWFDYNGYRYKDFYCVKTKGGVELTGLYPNGGGWYNMLGLNKEVEALRTGSGSVRDEEVVSIRLMTDES